MAMSPSSSKPEAGRRTDRRTQTVPFLFVTFAGLVRLTDMRLALRCVDFVATVPFYLEGALSPFERVISHWHGRSCPNCGAFFRQHEAVRAALVALRK